MAQPTHYHMSPEEFRVWGHAVVDWIAAYQRRVDSLPVTAQVEPGRILARLPRTAPERGEPFRALLEDFENLIQIGRAHV
jgi:aromatic-L-amino-acid decarboxylase